MYMYMALILHYNYYDSAIHTHTHTHIVWKTCMYNALIPCFFGSFFTYFNMHCSLEGGERLLRAGFVGSVNFTDTENVVFSFEDGFSEDVIWSSK